MHTRSSFPSHHHPACVSQKLKKHLTLKPASPSTIALQLVHFQVTQGAAQRRMKGITEAHTCDSHNRRPHPHHDHHCHPALKTIFNCGTCLGVDFFYQVHIFNLEDCVDIDLRVHQSSSDNRRQGLLFDSHWRQGILKLRQDWTMFCCQALPVIWYWNSIIRETHNKYWNWAIKKIF